MNKIMASLSSVGLILTAAIWGFAFVIVKDSLTHIGAVWMVAFRFTIAAVLLALFYCTKLKQINASYLKQGAMLGLVLFLAYFTQTIGCDYTTAGKNAFLTTTYVILIPLISWGIYRKKPRFYVFIAAILSVTGIGLLALNGNDGSLLKMNLGDILTLVCSVFYAIHIIFVAKFNEHKDPILLTVLQFVFAALFGWMTAPFYDGAFPAQALMSSRVMFSMIYLGVFSTLICFVMQNVCLKYVNSAIASLFLSLESVFGVLFSALLLHEMLSLRMICGCILIFAAILIAEVLPKLCD